MGLIDLPDSLITLSKKEIEENRKAVHNKYSQKPSIKDRRHPNLNDKHVYHKLVDRNEFLKDRDRIIFSKSFRRLEHKAQVYSHEKGDHFRTRLTHTLEVMQIAKSIGKNLGLNEDLIEAIALGHDIGHTPFGHAGEEVLDQIMRGKDDLGGKLKFKINYGGFKHNFHSLRILDILERKYENKKGLNLTWQVLEGILKHTKTKKGDKEWSLNRFIQCPKILEPFMNEPFFIKEVENEFIDSVTLEGQVVAVADEIAQRQHDLDDGLRDNDLKLRENEIICQIQKAIDESYDSAFKVFREFNGSYSGGMTKDISLEEIGLLQLLKEKIEKREEQKKFGKHSLINKIKQVNNFCKTNNFSKNQMDLLNKITDQIEIIHNGKKSSSNHIWTSLVRDITEYFILDVTIHSLKEISKLEEEIQKKGFSEFISKETCEHGLIIRKKNILLTKKIIDFSYPANELDDKIENYINNSILNSYDVNRFDGKAYFIIRQLFKAYYANPRQMPKELLIELSNRIQNNITFYNCKIKLEIINTNKVENKEIIDINFEDSSPNEIAELIKLLKLNLKISKINQIFNLSNDFSYGTEEFENILKDLLNIINKSSTSYSLEEISDDDSEFEKYKKEFNKNFYQKWLITSILNKINKCEMKDIHKISNVEARKLALLFKCLLELHYSYISIICDHIAMMTDNYAKNEYNRLYLV